MSTANPYEGVGGVPAADGFVERAELVRTIESVWRSPGRLGNLSVLGQHRFGKTSVVEQALRRIDRVDLAVVRVSVVELDSVFGLFRTLTSEVTAKFPSIPDLDRFNTTVRNARGWYDLENAVTTYFEAAGRRGIHVLLVLDEFDRAPWVLVDLSAYQLLRSLVSEPRYSVGLVTLSRRSVFEIEADAAGGSRLDGVMSSQLYVGLLEPVEVAELLDLAGAVGVDLHAVESELLARCGRHPYLLGILCRRVVHEFAETGEVDVRKAHELEAASFHSYFDRLIEEVDLDLSGRGTALLHAVASGGPVSALHAEDVQDLVNKGVLIRRDDSVGLFSDELAAYLRSATVGTTAPRPSAAARYRCTALVVATEWSSAHGGLSTFNRELCLALARERVRVVCLVVNATDDEVGKAKAAGVTLLRSRPVDGADEMASLMHRPQLPEGAVPDLVIGHGRITGPAAQVQAAIFPSAKKLHFVHMAPDETEWHKPDRQNDATVSADNRTWIEVRLGRAADRLVAVGPRLHGRFRGYFAGRDDTDALRFDPGFDLTDPRPRKTPDGNPLTVLLMGRTEDAELKGLDLAAAACGLVADWRHKARRRPVELVVRGVPEEEAEQQKRKLDEWAANPKLNIVPRLYTTDEERLADDLIRASLVIMPSRAEGFGLVAQEAIVDGTPVLVSEASGLGMLLREVLGDERAASWVVPMSGDLDSDIQTWAREIDSMLWRSEQKFGAAEALRVDLAERLPWSRSVDGLLTEIGF
ncbi:glycosyltransferase [Streptomyces sp. NBC_01485]|uniref:glycosyltransferase n=1 Tax=Streptomyces sp. NBC_01485 TaxID=2903884 RepID=UPI002E3384D0|nr:glycosyltransferase [Streptomyces sp. NBC_01485]